jgi:hypothetical protein
LADWWQALQAHPGCRKSLDHYTVELEKFLQWLRERMAQRNGGVA